MLLSKSIKKFSCLAVMWMHEQLLNLQSAIICHNYHVIGEDAMFEFRYISIEKISIAILPF